MSYQKGKHDPVFRDQLCGFDKGGSGMVEWKIGTYTMKSKARKLMVIKLFSFINTVTTIICTIFPLNQSKGPKTKSF